MSGFKPRIYGVGSDRSSNWATTTAHLIRTLKRTTLNHQLVGQKLKNFWAISFPSWSVFQPECKMWGIDQSSFRFAILSRNWVSPPPPSDSSSGRHTCHSQNDFLSRFEVIGVTQTGSTHSISVGCNSGFGALGFRKKERLIIMNKLGLLPYVRLLLVPTGLIRFVCCLRRSSPSLTVSVIEAY